MATGTVKSLVSTLNSNIGSLTQALTHKYHIYGGVVIDIDTIDTDGIYVGHTPDHIRSTIGLPSEFQANTYVAVITLNYIWRMQIVCSMHKKVIAYRVYNSGAWHDWTVLTDESPMYMTKGYSYAYSCPASGAVNITGTNMGLSTPAGYTPIAVLSYSTNSNEVMPRSMNAGATGSTSFCVLTNKSASAVSFTLQATILYAKNN